MAYQDPMTGEWLVVRVHRDGKREWLKTDRLGSTVEWVAEKDEATRFPAEYMASNAIASIVLPKGSPRMHPERAA